MSSFNFQQNSDLMALNKSIKFMEKRIYDLKKRIQSMELHLDDLEQYSRSNCIVLHNSNIEQSNNYKAFCEELIAKLDTNLKLTDKLHRNEVDIAHILLFRKKDKTKSPPIIIKFIRRSTRNDVFFSKKKLAGTVMFKRNP